MTEQKMGFQWKRITFIFLGLLMLAALIPAVAFGTLTGEGTKGNPYKTEVDSEGGVRIFLSDKDGKKMEELNKTEPKITLSKNQPDPLYLLLTYEDGETLVKAGDYVKYKTLYGKTEVHEVTRLYFYHDGNKGYLWAGTTVNGEPVDDWGECNASFENPLKIDVSKCEEESNCIGYTPQIQIALNGSEGEIKYDTVAPYSWKNGIIVNTSEEISITGLRAWSDKQVELGYTGFIGETFQYGLWPTPDYTTETGYQITVTSSNQEVIADSEIKVEKQKSDTNDYLVKAPMKKGGTTKLKAVLKTKNNKTFESKELTVTVKSHRQDYNTGFSDNILPIGIEASLADKYQIYPSTVDQSMKWTSSDPSVISVDSAGNLNALSVGKATITATSNYDPSIVMTWDLIADRPELYLDGKKLTEDTVLIDGEKTSGDLKVCYSTRPDKPLTWLQHFSSNTDVATYASTYGDTLNFHKNGTVDVYLYDRTSGNEENITYLVGHTIFKVTGKAEDARESSWTALTDAQIFDGNLNATQYAYHQLTSHPVESNTLNKAWFQNQITNRIPADEAVFTFRLGNRNPSTKFNEAAYLSGLYDKVTIRRVEDGRLGAVIASCNQGYTVENVKTEYGTSGQGTGVKEVIPTIKVDKGILERGKDYALVIDRRAEAPCGADLLMDADYRFTTVGPAKTVHLDKTEAVLKPGESLTLTAAMNKDEKVEADDSIVWKSSAPAIAEVDQQGKVTAKAPGKADIIAEAKYGKVKAVCKLTVEPIKATGVTVNAKSFTLTKGQSRQLTATVSPENASYKTVTWTSSNKKVVRVDEKGKVTAVSAGNATVTAKTKDGKYAKVTVKVRPKNTSFRLYGKRKEAVVKYSSVPGADGYRIYYATSKNGKYKIADTRKPKEEKRFSHKKLKAKRTYYYKMRTYEVVKGERIYSELSQPKKVRTK